MFEDEYNVNKLISVTALKTNLQLFVTPRYIHHYTEEEYEPFTTEIVLNYVKPGSTFVDIGAHYGYFSLLALSKLKKMRVVAIEPVPETFSILKKNLKQVPKADFKAINAAASDTDGKAEFNMAEASDSAGFYDHPNCGIVKKIKVKTVNVDNVLKDEKNIDFIKIDAEGHELSVLAGLESLLKKNKTKFLIEFNPPCLEKAGRTPEELISLMEGYNYDVYFIHEFEKRLYRLTDNMYSWDQIITGTHYGNILCIPKKDSDYTVFFSHTANVGGAEKSFQKLLSTITSYGLFAHVVFPQPDGPFYDAIDNKAISRSNYSYEWWAQPEVVDSAVLADSMMNTLENKTLIEKLNPHSIATITSVIPWGGITAKLMDVPHVWFIHEFLEKDHGYRFVLTMKETIQLIGMLSEYVICNSNAVAKVYKEYMPEKKVKVLYPQVTLPDDINQPVDAIFTHKGSLRFVILGHLKQSKGQLLAAQAVQELIEEGLNIELAIIGRTDTNDRYVDRVTGVAEKSGGRIHMLGQLGNALSYAKQADIGLMCSEIEAFGRVTMELLLLGKPVIGTASGGTLEIIQDGKSGRLFEPGNKEELKNHIRYFYENKTDEKKWAAAAREGAMKLKRKNSYERNITNYIDNTKLTRFPLPKTKEFIRAFCNAIVREHEQFGKGYEHYQAIIDSQQATQMQLREQIRILNEELKVHKNVLQNITSAKTFKIWQLATKLKRKILRQKDPAEVQAQQPAPLDNNELYLDWYKNNKPTPAQITVQRTESALFELQPVISIIMPTYNTDPRLLREAIESVMAQSYTKWELCIADDASPNAQVRGIIKEYAEKDGRIKYTFLEENGHISHASNEAMKLATGAFIGLLDHDDYLWPNALFEMVKTINQNPEADFLYSDEDKITHESDLHLDAFFKPDWNPDFLRTVNYIAHFTVIRRSLMDEIGGWRKGFEGAQDWDLFLRATFAAEKKSEEKGIFQKRIIHVPTVLYSWRKTETSTSSGDLSVKPYVVENQKKSLEDDLKNRGLTGDVLPVTYENDTIYWRVKYDIKDSPLVSIIIPTKNAFEYISVCLRSILEKTTYSNYEILITDTGSTDRKVLDLYKSLEKKHSHIRTLHWNEPFNFASVCNFAVEQSNGDYIVLLNNDTEIITKDWIESMLEHAARPEVGAVGCKLLYPDKSIQHAGIILGLTGSSHQKGVAGHAFIRVHTDVRNTMVCGVRDYAGVTAACLMIAKAKYNEVNGQDNFFKIAFNDVDFNLKVLHKGYYNVYTGFTELYHHESISVGTPGEGTRDLKVFEQEITKMHEKWGAFLQNDPYYNINLSLHSANFAISPYRRGTP